VDRLWTCTLYRYREKQGLLRLMTIARTHSSKRVPTPQSISAIRLIVATLTCFKTTCYGLPPRSYWQDAEKVRQCGWKVEAQAKAEKKRL